MKKSQQDDNNNLDIKTKEYKVALEKYNTVFWYTRTETVASVIVITLQIATLITLFPQYNASNIMAIIMTIVIAYVATDFINGLAHMIADNTTNYTSFVGPFFAAFKLHHSKLYYQSKHPIKIYFYESGHKLWLVFYLLIIFIVQHCVNLNFCLNLFLVIIGTLSSVAELSHFWCHNSQNGNAIIRALQKYRLLLSMKHHRIHHCSDNINYAFLNGLTDPLLNIIARIFYQGYKNRSDLHINDQSVQKYLSGCHNRITE